MEFRGKGFWYRLLNPLLKWKRPEYNKYGWHVGFIREIVDGVPIVNGMGGHGPADDRLTDLKNVRVYRVFRRPPQQKKVDEWVADNRSCKYSNFTYVFTIINTLLNLHFRLWNNWFTCWTYLAHFLDDMGKETRDEKTYPLLTDFSREKLVYEG
ncbi:MAG: hypothetical protein TUN42_04240 [Dehalogenimonas sp.]